jgi:serine/threonine-protein kinase RsbW
VPTVRTPLSINLPAARSSVDAARLAVLEYLEPEKLDARTIFDFELVLEELLVNVALHGFPSGVEGVVDLTIDVDPACVRLRLEDDGMPFDPASAPIKPPPPDLDATTPGGLGLHLVRKHAREVVYERRDGRNVTSVTIDRQRADAR